METIDAQNGDPGRRRDKLIGYLVHAYTAAGLLCAVLATDAILDGDYRLAFVWMIVAVAIDATDGTLARRYRVRQVVPHIDGRKLDDIVDYVNYTFLPLLMIGHAGWLPEPIWFWIAIPLIASVFAFAHTGAKQEQSGFFLGFPSYWNVFAFYTATCFRNGGPWVVLALAIVLSVLSVLPIRFVYPNQAPRWRSWFLGGAVVWMAILCVMLARFESIPAWLFWLSAVYPVCYAVLSVYLDFSMRRGEAERQ